MKRSWTSTLIAVTIVLVLTFFFALQIRWLTQASEADRERMQRRVEADTRRFAEDFNRELQALYINFQIGADKWRSGDLTEFNERYAYWSKQAADPRLVQRIVFVETGRESKPQEYDPASGRFVPAKLDTRLEELIKRTTPGGPIRNVHDDLFALNLPIYDLELEMQRITVTRNGQSSLDVKPPNRYGNLIITLDEDIVKGDLLPELARKYFPNRDFSVSVSDRGRDPVFSTGNINDHVDASAGLWDLAAENMVFFTSRELRQSVRDLSENRVVITRRMENGATSVPQPPQVTVGRSGDAVRFEVDRSKEAVGPVTSTTAAASKREDIWKLQVNHVSGSIDSHISGQRNKGIVLASLVYLLLVGSIGAITFSAFRARQFAQRQMEFVSSVSHEFRTPLAVIYSAGENLADGVTKDGSQVNRYGELIKLEGRKLSAMVEQILEFAGARSGNRKFHFETVEPGSLIESVLAEFTDSPDLWDFQFKTDISPNLPMLEADPEALSAALRNLIQNAVKYSNGNKWLSVSAHNDRKRLTIAVEDKGIGVEPRETERIFEPFYRGKAVVDAQIHGNGLGLSLVKQTAEAHGGRVFVESRPGEGSKFTIELPLSHGKLMR
jgi:signal transduction histidine kinase